MITLTHDALSLNWSVIIVLVTLAVFREWSARRADTRDDIKATEDQAELIELLGEIRDYLHDSYTTQEEISKTLTAIRDDRED